MSVSILIVDDESLISRGISMILSAEPDLEVIGEVGDGALAITVARHDQPDVVLMDVRMPGMDGLSATRALTADSGSDRTIKVLILTTFDEDEIVYGALRAGASGFILKQAAPADLVTAIHRVAAGDAWIDPAVAPRVIARLASLDADNTMPPDLLDRLTKRECDVLRLVARGMTNDEIAAHFTLSEATVRTHVTRILMKTGSSTRAQAVVLAYESGLVIPRRGGNPPRSTP